MNTLLQPWLTRRQHWDAQDTAVADELAQVNLRRLRWLVVVVMPVIAAYLAIFWLGSFSDSASVQNWKRSLVWLHLAFLCWWVLLGGVSAWLTRNPMIAIVRALQVVIPLGCVVFSAAYAIADQRVTPNISPYLIGCIFTSLLMLMRLRVAMLVQAVGFAVFFVGLGITQEDSTHQLTNRANGLMAALISVLMAWMLWRKDAGFLVLQRELLARNQLLETQKEELLRLSQRDALTGLYNRGELLRHAEEELLRARRRNTATSVIMVDLDHFKRVNDTYGHQAGDEVLKQAADVLARGVRATDLVGRIGGEEFMIVLPATGLTAANEVASKLNQQLRDHPMELPGRQVIMVTASSGVATVAADMTGTVAWLYAAADHALYEAKRAGRDRVHSTDPDPHMTASDYQRLRKS